MTVGTTWFLVFGIVSEDSELLNNHQEVSFPRSDKGARVSRRHRPVDRCRLHDELPGLLS